MRQILFALAIPCCAFAGAGAGAADIPAAVRNDAAVAARPVGHKPGLTMLYNQMVDDSGIATLSTAFYAIDKKYDSYAADDFTVPTGSSWTVAEIDFMGHGGGTVHAAKPIEYFGIEIYASAHGRPCKVIVSVPKVAARFSGDSPSFIKLPKQVTLKAGTYFLSIYIHSPAPWGWENTTTAQSFGDPAVWENPNGGEKSDCKTWGVETVCRPRGQGPDHLFAIQGTAQ